MADCKACGKWFATMEQCELCPTCERALERLRNYAAPVVHGRWIDHKTGEQHRVNVCIECSECNTWFGHDCYAKTNYCPNCGARMDLEEGAEDDGKEN